MRKQFIKIDNHIINREEIRNVYASGVDYSISISYRNSDDKVTICLERENSKITELVFNAAINDLLSD